MFWTAEEYERARHIEARRELLERRWEAMGSWDDVPAAIKAKLEGLELRCDGSRPGLTSGELNSDT